MRLLLVEDDLKIALFIREGLQESGFAVDHAMDGEEGLHLALTEPYDLAIIDLMLPKTDGLTIIAEIRKEQINIPVIILSAKRSVDDREEMITWSSRLLFPNFLHGSRHSFGGRVAF